MSEIPLATLLEATLFSAGRSLSLVELSETLGYEEDEISESWLHYNLLLNDVEVAVYKL